MSRETPPRSFSVAGATVSFGCALEDSSRLYLDDHFADFETQRPADLRIVVGEEKKLSPSTAPLLFESELNWRLLEAGAPDSIFELYNPQTREVYCQARLDFDKYEWTVVFDIATIRSIGAGDQSEDPFLVNVARPLDQLAYAVLLAERNGLLVHASAAVLDGKAYVFAGHSGDGKTTLSRLIAEAGFELLSDERIAIKNTDKGFYAYGTPWPGEGNIVSSKSYPLGGVFILEKASGHEISEGHQTELVAEFLSRSIVPYYLTESASQVFATAADMAASIPIRTLEFARRPGVAELIQKHFSNAA